MTEDPRTQKLVAKGLAVRLDGLLLTFTPKSGHETQVAQFLRDARGPKHLTGRVPRELANHALGLLASPPDMDKCDVLAAKLEA